MDVLHLHRSPPRQFVVQMLTGAAKWLPRPLRFGAEAIAVGAGGFRQQVLIELVAIAGDVWQKRG
jgi:hypothetical protein